MCVSVQFPFYLFALLLLLLSFKHEHTISLFLFISFFTNIYSSFALVLFQWFMQLSLRERYWCFVRLNICQVFAAHFSTIQRYLCATFTPTFTHTNKNGFLLMVCCQLVSFFYSLRSLYPFVCLRHFFFALAHKYGLLHSFRRFHVMLVIKQAPSFVRLLSFLLTKLLSTFVYYARASAQWLVKFLYGDISLYLLFMLLRTSICWFCHCEAAANRFYFITTLNTFKVLNSSLNSAQCFRHIKIYIDCSALAGKCWHIGMYIYGIYI